MDKELGELIEISRLTGSDKSLVLGPFGNTSVKTEDGRYMYIKASGTNLADMTEDRGWRKLRLEGIRKTVCDPDIAEMDEIRRDEIVADVLMNSTCDDFLDDIKPSVESSFHALLGRYVVHLHPAAVLGYACCAKGKELISQLFGDPEITPVWVPHASFGMELALQIAEAGSEYALAYGFAPRIYIFENHGLAVISDTFEGVCSLIEKVMDIFKSRFERGGKDRVEDLPNADIESITVRLGKAVSKSAGIDVPMRYYIDDNIIELMGREDAMAVTDGGAVTYDELLEAGGGPVWLENSEDGYLEKRILEAAEKSPVFPKGFVVKGVGLFVAGDNYELVSNFISSYLTVRMFAADNGGIVSANPSKYMRYVKSK